jgi:acetyl-CoA acetyltransferase
MTGAVIAGIGQTEFSKCSGRSELQLAAEAAHAAIADAGLTPADIDGTVTFVLDTTDELALMTTLGIAELRYTARTRGGGGGANATVQLAATAVASGAADAVLVYRAFNERSGHRFGQPPGQLRGPVWNWYHPFGLDTPAKVYGLAFQRYMSRFGVTNEDFGRYTVVARKHAATNPRAWFYQRPITIEDHQRSRWIVEPVLRLLDCCQESDGGVALVITRDNLAADLAQPVGIRAASQSHLPDGDELFNYFHPELGEFAEAASLGRQLYRAAGLVPDDIDVAMIYENFSPVVPMQLEAYGFCGAGEGTAFIADGHIEIGGQTPVNPNGGLLGEGYIHGMNNITEAVRQLRGTAANQVDDVEHVLVATGRSGLILGHA